MDVTRAIGIWIAAIEAEWVAGAPWREWAERRVAEMPRAPAWLLDLMDAPSAAEALGALHEGAADAVRSGALRDPWRDQRALIVGFLWLEHRAGRLTLAEALDRAGGLADAANWSPPAPNCEAFYLLLNEIDGGGPVDPSPGLGTTAERAAALFAPFAARTREDWQATTDETAG